MREAKKLDHCPARDPFGEPLQQPIEHAPVLSHVVIFIALAFWSWVWGVPGMLLAVPMLMAAKAIADHVDGLQGVADFLGEKPFLMGGEPTEIDAAAYGLLANILEAPIESPVKDAALARRHLVEYVDRMQRRFFP